MKTKHYTFIIWVSLSISSHAQLTRSLNSMRIGDEIIKQQIEYKNPGKAGTDCFWDFSSLKSGNSYTLTYSLPGILGDSLYVMGTDTFQINDANDLIVGTEHHTMYYYQIRNDSIIQLGHENPNTQMSYSKPMLQTIFPMNYGDVILSEYNAKGKYSGMIDINSKGSIRTEADAFGKMIIPAGDTLTVLRIKNTRHIMEPLILEDSTERYTNRVMETYQWYSKGYRYPVFETIRTIHLGDSVESFNTAFYYPPQEHYYLDSDPENAAILDSIWNIKHIVANKDIHENNYLNRSKHKIYPNPVHDNLYIEYNLDKESSVKILVYNTGGRLLYQQQKEHVLSDSHTETINCNILPTGNYILHIIINGKIISEKFIKK